MALAILGPLAQAKMAREMALNHGFFMWNALDFYTMVQPPTWFKPRAVIDKNVSNERVVAQV